MSSSRIIKSSLTNPDTMTTFSFQAINRGVQSFMQDTPSMAFTPMALFDNSGSTELQPQLEPEVLPEGTFITDEDLDQRLRESFSQGLTEGKNLAERGLVHVFKALRTSSEQILSMREKVLRESEGELLNLLMQLTRKIIHSEISQDRTILSNIIRNALAGLPDRDEITVRLNPDDYALIQIGHDDMLPPEHITRKMILKQDPTIMIGSCKIDTEMGVIDATIESQLDEVFRHLKEERAIMTGDI